MVRLASLMQRHRARLSALGLEERLAHTKIKRDFSLRHRNAQNRFYRIVAGALLYELTQSFDVLQEKDISKFNHLHEIYSYVGHGVVGNKESCYIVFPVHRYFRENEGLSRELDVSIKSILYCRKFVPTISLIMSDDGIVDGAHAEEIPYNIRYCNTPHAFLMYYIQRKNEKTNFSDLIDLLKAKFEALQPKAFTYRPRALAFTGNALHHVLLDIDVQVLRCLRTCSVNELYWSEHELLRLKDRGVSSLSISDAAKTLDTEPKVIKDLLSKELLTRESDSVNLDSALDYVRNTFPSVKAYSLSQGYIKPFTRKQSFS